jgi:hypothetical protein
LGSYRNLGDLATSAQLSGDVEGRNPNASRLVDERAARRESEPQRSAVSQPIANQGLRDERRGVGAPRSSDEAGTPTRGTLRSEGGAGSRNRWRAR